MPVGDEATLKASRWQRVAPDPRNILGAPQLKRVGLTWFSLSLTPLLIRPEEDAAKAVRERHAFYGDHLENLALNEIHAMGSLPAVKAVVFENSKGVTP